MFEDMVIKIENNYAEIVKELKRIGYEHWGLVPVDPAADHFVTWKDGKFSEDRDYSQTLAIKPYKLATVSDLRNMPLEPKSEAQILEARIDNLIKKYTYTTTFNDQVNEYIELFVSDLRKLKR